MKQKETEEFEKNPYRKKTLFKKFIGILIFVAFLFSIFSIIIIKKTNVEGKKVLIRGSFDGSYDIKTRIVKNPNILERLDILFEFNENDFYKEIDSFHEKVMCDTLFYGTPAEIKLLIYYNFDISSEHNPKIENPTLYKILLIDNLTPLDDFVKKYSTSIFMDMIYDSYIQDTTIITLKETFDLNKDRLHKELASFCTDFWGVSIYVELESNLTERVPIYHKTSM